MIMFRLCGFLSKYKKILSIMLLLAFLVDLIFLPKVDEIMSLVLFILFVFNLRFYDIKKYILSRLFVVSMIMIPVFRAVKLEVVTEKLAVWSFMFFIIYSCMYLVEARRV